MANTQYPEKLIYIFVRRRYKRSRSCNHTLDVCIQKKLFGMEDSSMPVCHQYSGMTLFLFNETCISLLSLTSFSPFYPNNFVVPFL